MHPELSFEDRGIIVALAVPQDYNRPAIFGEFLLVLEKDAPTVGAELTVGRLAVRRAVRMPERDL